MSRVVHFEIQADDVERSKSFYAAVFDWSFEDYGPMTGSTYWGITTGPEDEPGINGGLRARPAPAPGAGQGAGAFVCTTSTPRATRSASTSLTLRRHSRQGHRQKVDRSPGWRRRAISR